MVSLGDTAISLHILQPPLTRGRRVFWERSDLDSGGKLEFGILGGGGQEVFWERSDLDSGKKIGVWKFCLAVLDQISEQGVLPNFSTKSALPPSGSLCITDATYVETKKYRWRIVDYCKYTPCIRASLMIRSKCQFNKGLRNKHN